MMRKLLLILLVFSLATAATAAEWLLPVQQSTQAQAYDPSDEAAGEQAPEHFVEPLQLLPVHLSGLQLRAELPDALPAHPVALRTTVLGSQHERRPDALIHRQRLLLTCTMQAMAP